MFTEHGIRLVHGELCQLISGLIYPFLSSQNVLINESCLLQAVAQNNQGVA